MSSHAHLERSLRGASAGDQTSLDGSAVEPFSVPLWVRPSTAAPTARGERTRRSVIEAAERLFSDPDNYENVSVSDIARESRSSVGTIYRYFSSKEDLLHLVLSNAFWRMYEATKGTWRREDDAATNLERTTQRYLEAYWSERAYIRLALQLLPTSDAVRDLWWQMRAEVRQRMKARLQQDQADAGMPPLDPELAIRALVGMVDDYAARAFIDEEYGPPRRSQIPSAARTLSRIWYRAVFARDASSEPA
jgi:AcrR family transcriptional regulator